MSTDVDAMSPNVYGLHVVESVVDMSPDRVENDVARLVWLKRATCVWL